MAADYPGAEWIPIPGFGYDPAGSHGREGHASRWIIVHKTASPNATAQDIATYFQGDPNNGTHFVIGRDGAVIQMVALADAAYGNAPVNPASHDAFWDSIGALNPNLVTVSIEHCTTTSDNSDPLTPEQQDASFKLIAWLCKTLNIPARPADANGGVTGHYSLDGINRAHCPGNYPWDALFSYIGGSMIPDGWTDDGAVLTAPNGIKIDTGMRTYITETYPQAHGAWPRENVPLAPEYTLDQISTVDASLGGGTRIDFLYWSLGWSRSKNAIGFMQDGKELAALKAQPQPPSDLQQRLDAANAALQTAQEQLKLLTEQEPADPVALQQRQTAALETVARAVVLLVPPSERAKLTS